MKTNQILTREMGHFAVLQRTSDGMFNATELLKQWNKQAGKHKKLDHFFEKCATKEFVEAIISEENLHARNSVYVKSRASRGANAGTWMHPLLFIDFAMWLNPTFKVKVLKFVYDQLIAFRNEAGDTYAPMCEAIASISKKEDVQTNITRVARAINVIIYGQHQRGVRNAQACENKLSELVQLQKEITGWINVGLIFNFDNLMQALVRKYNRKMEQRILTA